MKLEKKKRWIVSIILFSVTVALGIVSWLILPDRLLVHFRYDGTASGTIPKLPVMLISMALSAIGCLMNGKLDGKHAAGNSWERVVMGHDNSRGIVLATVGIGIIVLMILINSILVKRI